MTITLPQAFGLHNAATPQLVAFTGAGGKTSLMFALAGALPGTIVLTTTTRMAREQIVEGAASIPAAVARYPSTSAIACTRITAVVGPDIADDKVAGVESDVPAQLLTQQDIDYLLVEADGARLLPIKAPAAHEPVIPAGATLVVPVAGIDALDYPIGEVAHRPQLVATLLGKDESERVTAEDLAVILIDPNGGLKDVPDAATIIPAINKVENIVQLEAARRAAQLTLREPRVRQVAVTAAEQPQPVLEVWRRVTAIVLAAGESTRMGRPKLLLPWGKTTVLGQTIANVRASAVFDSVVVTGADAEKVGEIARANGLPLLYNEQYATGEMLSSLQTAIRNLSPAVDAVLVVLGDQPLVDPATIDQILIAYAQGKGAIVAPLYGQRRGNPVLIDRHYFERLLGLPAGAAPRDLLQDAPVHLVPVDSEVVLLDVDDPAAYEALKP